MTSNDPMQQARMHISRSVGEQLKPIRKTAYGSATFSPDQLATLDRLLREFADIESQGLVLDHVLYGQKAELYALKALDAKKTGNEVLAREFSEQAIRVFDAALADPVNRDDSMLWRKLAEQYEGRGNIQNAATAYEGVARSCELIDEQKRQAGHGPLKRKPDPQALEQAVEFFAFNVQREGYQQNVDLWRGLTRSLLALNEHKPVLSGCVEASVHMQTYAQEQGHALTADEQHLIDRVDALSAKARSGAGSSPIPGSPAGAIRHLGGIAQAGSSDLPTH